MPLLPLPPWLFSCQISMAASERLRLDVEIDIPQCPDADNQLDRSAKLSFEWIVTCATEQTTQPSAPPANPPSASPTHGPAEQRTNEGSSGARRLLIALQADVASLTLTTSSPTVEPVTMPPTTPHPTAPPTAVPTRDPTERPSHNPTLTPTFRPTTRPTRHARSPCHAFSRVCTLCTSAELELPSHLQHRPAS